MAIRLDSLVFFDIEQTCWDVGEAPEGFIPETIQIGICEYNPITDIIGRKQSFFVKPKSKISEYCTNLTGITEKKLKSARNLSEVCNKVAELYSKHKVWVSWGRDDLMLKKDCDAQNAISPVSNNHLDFSVFYTTMFGLRKFPSLVRSLEKNNIDFEGNQHDAMHDAINTAKLYSVVAKKLRG